MDMIRNTRYNLCDLINFLFDVSDIPVPLKSGFSTNMLASRYPLSHLHLCVVRRFIHSPCIPQLFSYYGSKSFRQTDKKLSFEPGLGMHQFFGKSFHHQCIHQDICIHMYREYLCTRYWCLDHLYDNYEYRFRPDHRDLN